MYLSPHALHVGDKVAIVAPASPFKTDELIESLDIIREVGLEPILGPNVSSLHPMNIHAASVEERANELNWVYQDADIKGIIVATGGNGSAGVLPYLDYEAIVRSRKVMLGMSDITSLHNGILARAGVIGILGQSPNVRLDRGKKIREYDSESLRIALEFMMDTSIWGERPFDHNLYLPRTVSSGKASGPVVGGNCETFIHLLGTPFFPSVAGSILFLEDVYKDGSMLSRAFLHLRLSGVLNSVAGVVIGEFSEVPKSNRDHHSPSIEDVIGEYFGNSSIPCTYGFSFSHGPMTIPIPIGSQCEIDADAGEVYFNFRMDNP
jgi:muramoyltetrapeptide carboxypeptidase